MNTLFLAFSLVLVGTEVRGTETARSAVPIGSQVTNLTFTDIRGLHRSLSELGEHKAKVLVFTNITCPLVKKYLPRLVELDKEFRSQGVLFVSVNVGSEDTVRQMAAQAVDYQVPFAFVKDMDFSCATSLGVRKTPEVVVLDSGNVIRYRGRIDDQLRIGGTKPQASREDLKEAIGEILADKPVTVPQTEVDGCWITPSQEPSAIPTSVTWASHIADLVHQKCTICHRPDTAAPFELISYEDVAGTAEMIADVVRLETMPPWYAARSHGEFQNDASLTLEEKRMLIGWIKAGCPAGELDTSPSPHEVPSAEWGIGEPDLIVTMKEVHTIPATGFIPYKYVLLPHYFAEETWVEAFEIKPLNRAIVHHCNMFHMSAGGAGVNTFITGYVPGGQPMDLGNFDNGVAYRLPAGSSLGLQIHYTTIGTEQQGQIQVGLRFPRREIKKQLHHFVLDPRGWTIPPYDPAFRIEASHQLKHNANILGMFTHMHVRGRDMTFFADQAGESSETLLQIPNYNFEWQLGYELAPGEKVFPMGTQIRAVAHFDNSPFNPYNPDPSAAVEYGPQTVDEMFNGFVFYVDQDETLSIRVNPTNGQVIDK
jgi:thiol-disulfide isomerase/thioredoxin